MHTKQILIIDDTEANRYVLRKILSSEPGYSIIEAANGSSGLTLLDESIDLVILDVNLPDMMGFELIRRAEEKLGIEKLPAIINVSATFVSGRDKAQGLNKGARAYLTHPINPDEMLATIGSLLRSDSQLQHVRAEREIATHRSENLENEKIMLERFVRSFSHDLRSPLGAATMSTELMRRYPAMRTDELLDTLQTNLKRIGDMITNVLDISQVSSGGGIRLAPDVQLLIPLLNEAIANLRLQIGNPIGIDFADVGPERSVYWDKQAFLRIFDNLIINAAKHGAAETPIDIRVKLTGDDAVLLQIVNRGTFPAEVLDNLATPYFISTRSDTKGWGLGLPIVKALCESFKGAVSFDNDGDSAVVKVRLPVNLPRGT